MRQSKASQKCPVTTFLLCPSSEWGAFPETLPFQSPLLNHQNYISGSDLLGGNTVLCLHVSPLLPPFLLLSLLWTYFECRGRLNNGPWDVHALMPGIVTKWPSMATGTSADVIKGDTGRVRVREEGHETTMQRDTGRCCPSGCEGRERGQEPTGAKSAALETAGGKEGGSPLKPLERVKPPQCLSVQCYDVKLLTPGTLRQ